MRIRAGRRGRTAAAVAAALLGLVAAAAVRAQPSETSIPPAVTQALEKGAASGGAWGLIRALEHALDTDPSLVATPQRAAALARVAGRLAATLPEVDADDREALRVLVLAYAPPATRGDAAPLVAGALATTALPRDEGIRLGSFRAYPGLGLSGVYDDNIFATRSDQKAGWAGHIMPSLLIRSPGGRRGISLDAGADIARYAQFDSENTSDAWAGSDAHYALGAGTILFGGGRFAHLHEDRSSPDDINGLEPTRYDDASGYLGLEHRLDRWSFRLGGTAAHLNFYDVKTLFGTLDNSGRDRLLTTGGLRVGYALGRGAELFAQGAYDGRRYDESTDLFGFDRSSNGMRVLAGFSVSPRSDLWLSAFGGMLRQHIEDPQLEDVSAPAFGAELEWRPREDTTLTGFVDRFLDDTTLPDASFNLVTMIGATLEVQIQPRIKGRLVASWAENDYQGIPRRDDVYYASAGLRLDVGHHIYLAPEYRFEHRSSNVATGEYTRNQIWLGFGADIPVAGQPRRRTRPLTLAAAPAAERPPPVPFSFDGPYAGVQLSEGALLGDLDAPRRSGTSTLHAPFANFGGTYGIFAGWGRTFGPFELGSVPVGRVYLGLEAEGEYSDEEWDHTGTEDRRVFSLDKTWSTGVSLRAGMVLRDAALLYGRFGGVWGRFKTDYTFGTESIDRSEIEPALRYGVGLEVPVSSWLFLRVDHTYTRYDHFNLDYSEGPDSFRPAELLDRFGLGLHFDGLLRLSGIGPQEPAPRAAPARLSGPYVGAFADQGVLMDTVTGPRETNGRLSADFGDQGFRGGLFAGYGHRFGDWYAGGEIAGGGSNVEWKHVRTNFGRTFSTQEKYSIRGSLRIGRVLNDSALLYVRGGAVRTQFQTTYQIGSVFVDQDDSRNGWLVGAGLEAAVTDRTFIRLEYDYSAYAQYKVDYLSGVDTFDPRASRAELAVGVRF